MRAYVGIGGLIALMILLVLAGATGQSGRIGQLRKEALGEDPKVAERAVHQLAKYPDAAVFLVEIGERPGGAQYDGVRLAAIQALLENPKEDYSPTVALMIRSAASPEMRLAVAKAVDEGKCGRGCVIEVYGQVEDLWAADRDVGRGMRRAPSVELAAKESAVRERLLSILRKEKVATVELATVLHTAGSRGINPSPFVVWLADQLEVLEFCPLLQSFSQVELEEAERGEINKVLVKLNCNLKPNTPSEQ